MRRPQERVWDRVEPGAERGRRTGMAIFPAAGATGAATVALAGNPKLGQILVNSLRTISRSDGGRHQSRTHRAAGTWLASTAALVLVTSGCTAATNTLHPGRETIKTGHTASLNTVLVDGEGRTLYLFVNDPPGHSACSGACASVWPPVSSKGFPVAGSGIAAHQLTTIHRGDGGTQVVYHGHPLYYYQDDTGSGDVYGEAIAQFGAEWYAVSPAGEQVEPKGGGSGGS